jgi:DNA-binding transcriptional LysR family regulator
MLGRIRSFLAVIEEGSVNRAAMRLGVAQPTISRHLQSLEQEFGGALFERRTNGMGPTDLGYFVRDKFIPLLKDYDLARAEVTAFAQGRQGQLRVGYIGSAAAKFVNPAAAVLKREFPALKLLWLDQTPSEQLAALRAGQIDLAVIGQEGAALGGEFYQRCRARLRVCVALPSDHPLAARDSFPLLELKSETFIGVSESAVPGRNRWIGQLCAKAGFRPRFVAETTNISETFTLIASDRAVALLPDYLQTAAPPGVAFCRLSDPWARWELFVLRQRGRGSAAARRLVELIGCSPAATRAPVSPHAESQGRRAAS